MDLLDRYLHAVRFWLPRAQQDDIIAELSEDIHSQIDEQEAAVGRKLNDSELEALLRQRGRPVLVANRYRPQQYLIGPALFPVYRFVVFIVALCYLIPWLLAWVALAMFDPSYHASFGRTFGPLWGTFWVTTFVALGAVTLVFAILERVRPRVLENWNPRTLPPVRDKNRIPRFNSLFELAANGVFVVWWLSWMWPLTIFDRGGVRLVLAPAWHRYFGVLLAVALGNAALAAVNLAYRYWTWRRAILRLILEAAGAIAICWLLRVNILAQLVVPNLPVSRAAQIVNSINLDLSRSFPFAVFCCAIILVLSNAFRLARLRTKGRPIVQGQGAALL